MKFLKFKNLPLSFKISLMALFSIAGISLLTNIFVKAKIIAENSLFFQVSAEQCLDSIVESLNSGNIASACELMKKASERNLTSFFIIQAGGVPVCFAPLDQADAFNKRYQQFNEVVHSANDNYDYKSLKVNKFVATAGWLNTSRANLANIFLLKLPTLLLGILISVLVIALIVFRETRPIKKLLLIFKKSEKVSDNIENQKAGLSSAAIEIQQLWNSAKEYEQAAEELKSEVRYVASDIQNILRREIAKKDEKIPYRFLSSVLRFDMNNYTKTYLENPEATQLMITRLSVEVDELVHRYQGAHYGFGGDEFIIVFRDSEGLFSRYLAFACMRDIFLRIDEIFNSSDLAKRLTLKAAIHQSENVLFELPNGLFLRGLNLILSQRLLTTIATKDEHKLVVESRDSISLKDLCEFAPAHSVQLKGFSDAFEICEPIRYEALGSILERRAFDKVPYFRSDLDVMTLFSVLSQDEISKQEKMKILDCLKSFQISQGRSALLESFMSCFLKLDRNVSENKAILSSLLISAENLIPKELWTEEASDLLLNSNCKEDSRCNSNILQLLAQKVPAEKFDAYAEKILMNAKGPDFRAVGNYLIVKANNGLTDQILNECITMLKSKNDLEIATGIYASSRIIQSQKLKDPVALSQFGLVQDLISRIRNLQFHDDNMISTRALFEMRELTQIENN